MQYCDTPAKENPDLKLLPGMTATCTIVTEEVENALSVPVAAIKFSPAEGTPMLDPRDAPKPPKPMHKKSDDDFGPPPPPGMSFGGGSAGKKKSSSPPKLKGKNVWINVNGKAAFRPVKTGITDGVNVQILFGLNDGDSVVVKQESAAEIAQESEERSPFMPGPRKRKK